MIAGMLAGVLILALGFAAGYRAASYFRREPDKKDPYSDYRDDKGLLSRRKVGGDSGREKAG
ncbi:MAG: hypothetical protein WC455_26700 [Dehalococcoidia bacterium]